MDYFYDEKIRRLIRIFGGFTVRIGKDSNGNDRFRQVPIRYGETSRMVSQIIREVSENTILSTPFMSVTIVSINLAADRRQNPFLVTTHQVDEREFDPETGQYTTQRGDRYTFKRHMPVPYNFTMQLDIWTSNVDQKMQIIEQIMMLFNPAQKLQSSDNPLDWTAITDIEMQDAISWSSRSQPLGTEETIDVSSMQFLVPYWINPPAELTKRKVIETIVQNDTDFAWDRESLLFQQIYTPNCNVLEVDGNILTLLNSEAGLYDENGNILSWEELIFLYGDYCPEESKITIKRKFGDPDGITGTFAFTSEPNKLVWTVDSDTLPANTLPDVDAIIDPTTAWPSSMTNLSESLPAATIGQRYLIVEDMAESSIGWGTLTATANDIIEYDGSNWFVAFDSETASSSDVVLNTFTDKQYRFNIEELDWEPVIDGKYRPGTWKIILRDSN